MHNSMALTLMALCDAQADTWNKKHRGGSPVESWVRPGLHNGHNNPLLIPAPSQHMDNKCQPLIPVYIDLKRFLDLLLFEPSDRQRVCKGVACNLGGAGGGQGGGEGAGGG